MKVVRTFFLFVVCVALVSLGGFALGGTPLALPAVIAGLGSFLIALG
jgi:hypothetical protein